MNENIDLIFYENKYDEDLAKFELESTQEQFTAYPHEVLQTLTDLERHYILIVQEQE